MLTSLWISMLCMTEHETWADKFDVDSVQMNPIVHFCRSPYPDMETQMKKTICWDSVIKFLKKTLKGGCSCKRCFVIWILFRTKHKVWQQSSRSLPAFLSWYHGLFGEIQALTSGHSMFSSYSHSKRDLLKRFTCLFNSNMPRYKINENIHPMLFI